MNSDVGIGKLSLGIQQPGCEADHLLLSVVVVKNECMLHIMLELPDSWNACLCNTACIVEILKG